MNSVFDNQKNVFVIMNNPQSNIMIE